MNDEEKNIFQQKYLEFQLLEQQIHEVYKQQQILNHKLQELTKLEENLSFLEKGKYKKQLFAQIGSKFFLKAELKDNKQVLVNVGANIMTEKPIEEAKQLVSFEIKETNDVLNEINQHLINASVKLQDLQYELEELQNKSEK